MMAHRGRVSHFSEPMISLDCRLNIRRVAPFCGFEYAPAPILTLNRTGGAPLLALFEKWAFTADSDGLPFSTGPRTYYFDQNPDGKAASRLICSPVMAWWKFRNWACRKYPPSPGRPGRFSSGWPDKQYRGSAGGALLREYSAYHLKACRKTTGGRPTSRAFRESLP